MRVLNGIAATFVGCFVGACGDPSEGSYTDGEQSVPESADGGADVGGGSGAGGARGVSTGGTSPSGAGGSAPSVGGAPETPPDEDALGAYPVEASPLTRGGTMTFTNVGAPGSWPRRLDREPGDPACDYKDGQDTWGGHCCQEDYRTESNRLAPFDEEMTLILKAIEIKQLAIYQPSAAVSDARWRRVTAWDARGTSDNLWFTQKGVGSASFPGDLTRDDCVGYLMQEAAFDCGDGADYYCPDDPGVLHEGFSGSKLIVFLGSMDFVDEGVTACDGDGAGHPGPWVALAASELVRDGGRKWNGLCNCYSKTGSVGDGCGEINVFEVVMDDNDYSNRQFASTGVRSYQAGHVGGNVCGVGCDWGAFPPSDVEVVDACAGVSYETGPEIEVGGTSAGCPVWRRPRGDRYFFILLDEARRMIQVGIVHPEALPAETTGLLPGFSGSVDRDMIDALLDLRLPRR